MHALFFDKKKVLIILKQHTKYANFKLGVQNPLKEERVQFWSEMQYLLKEAKCIADVIFKKTICVKHFIWSFILSAMTV